MTLVFPKKKKHEKEEHFYICEKCGCFYQIIDGYQIRQDQTNLKYVDKNNFHAAEDHRCIKEKTEGKLHKGLLKK